MKDIAKKTLVPAAGSQAGELFFLGAADSFPKLPQKQKCYFCGEEFSSVMHSDHFCEACKERNELLRKAGVFPNFSDDDPSPLFG